METSCTRVLNEHRELKSRNASEKRREPGKECTGSDVNSKMLPAAPAEDCAAGAVDYDDSLWGRGREFDWGDQQSGMSGTGERSEHGC